MFERIFCIGIAIEIARNSKINLQWVQKCARIVIFS